MNARGHADERATTPFHVRFDIPLDVDEARRQFMNRACAVANKLLFDLEFNRHRDNIYSAVAIHLGERHDNYFDLAPYLTKDFLRCLWAIEQIQKALSRKSDKEEFSKLIDSVMLLNEVDIGVGRQVGTNGFFYKSGAKILDEQLVNEPLRWLTNDPKFSNAVAPFEKGLSDFMRATGNPLRYGDVITEMYQALEATAKAVCNNDKDLSANRERFIKAVDLSDYYKKMLKDYIEYANEMCRHAARPEEQRSLPKPQEVEAFVYTTGLFIRLAVERLRAQEAQPKV